TATTITLPLPAQASGSATPRVWELQCSYRTRISKVDDWLGAVVARLPRGLQVIDVPCVGKDQSVARYPENYDRVLTNDLGWRHKFMGGFSGAAGREWRPAVEAPTPQQRSWAEKIVRELGGQRIAILALALTTPGGAGSNKSPAMVIIKKEFAVYRGQLDGITEESVRIRAPVANESGQFETVEVRIADIRQWAFGKYALEDPEAVFEWMMTPHPMLDPRIDARMVAQQLAQQTNRSSPTAGFRRSS
ncbi:MAG: hypothetical protein NT154_01765, partial [Verrucomicrobia bacterium]|nr:hypothetical protein [Verrucomicrobiota bacterium]